MSMNQTPQGERVHIALFGRRNVGKSSLVNAMTGQAISIVSEVKGTTTDPVKKAMELLPLGPVLIIDTPGLDDEGELGNLRMERTLDILKQTDIALLVLESGTGIDSCERSILDLLQARKLPYALVLNKSDRAGTGDREIADLKALAPVPILRTSSTTGEGIRELKEVLAHLLPDESPRQLVGDLLQPGDWVLLVTPIDKAAPKGRLILPQQQTIRDILDSGAQALVTRETELKQTLASLSKPPRLVITDSQVFGQVAAEVPREIPLTSFSILFARYKGDLDELVRGSRAIGRLKDGDRILMAEGCTHHRQGDDIGTVKIPNWLEKRSGKRLVFDHSSGIGYGKELSDYALIVHCGGCILIRREMLSRISQAREKGVPIVNYGILIAAMKGILSRCLEPFA